MASLIWDEPLPARCREHILSGTYKGIFECHIENDWIMFYHKTSEKIGFYRTGTHSDYL
jgi:mRNA interferase YafQ